MRAPYDEIADWYEHEFLGPQDARAADPLGISHCLRALLGAGSGPCLEIACGTGTKKSWTDKGVRDKVGAAHFPLPDLLNAISDAGLVLERFAEGGAPTPMVLAVRARKPRP
jgi:hypothetical protein